MNLIEADVHNITKRKIDPYAKKKYFLTIKKIFFAKKSLYTKKNCNKKHILAKKNPFLT